MPVGCACRRAVRRGRRLGLVPRPGLPDGRVGRSPNSATSRTARSICRSRSATRPRGRSFRLSTSPRRSASPAPCARSRTPCSCCAARVCGLAAFGSACSSARGTPRHPIRTPPTSRRVDPQALAAVCTLDDCPTLFEEALAWDAEPSPRSTPRPSSGASRGPALRDIALVQWCGGLAAGDEALDAQLRWESGEEYPAHLAMQMWGEGERPDPDRLEAALALARRIAAAAPREVRAGALATCGWLAWALGRSTHAERYAHAGVRDRAGARAGEIVRSFVHAGHLPDWAFERPARREREEHQLAVGARHEVVRVAQPPEVDVALHDPRAGVAVGEATHHLEGVVGRPVVADEDLEVRPGLRGEALEGPRDEGGAVVRRNQGRHERVPRLGLHPAFLPHHAAISVASSRASHGAVEYLPVSTE